MEVGDTLGKAKSQGRRLEVYVYQVLKEYGFRLTESSGSGENEKLDLLSDEYGIECKSRKASHYVNFMYEWLEKAEIQAKEMGVIPVVIFRAKGKQKPIVVMNQSDINLMNDQYEPPHLSTNRAYRRMYVNKRSIAIPVEEEYVPIARDEVVYRLVDKDNDRDLILMSLKKFILWADIQEEDFEEWRVVPTVTELEISNKGNVRYKKDGRPKSVNALFDNGQPRFYVIVKKKRYSLQRLYLQTWCNAPLNDRFRIVYLDGDLTNYDFSNLAWELPPELELKRRTSFLKNKWKGVTFKQVPLQGALYKNIKETKQNNRGTDLLIVLRDLDVSKGTYYLYSPFYGGFEEQVDIQWEETAIVTNTEQVLKRLNWMKYKDGICKINFPEFRVYVLPNIKTLTEIFDKIYDRRE